MGARRLTAELYETIKTAYAEKPANHSNAARAAGVSRRFAAKTWSEGWRYDWAPAIGRALEHAARAGRAEIESRAAALLSAAEDDIRRRLEAFRASYELDSASTAMAEAAASRTGLLSAEGLAALVLELVEGARKVVAGMRQTDLDELTPGERLRWARVVVAIATESASVTKTSLEVERLRVGSPTSIIGHQQTTMTDAQARQAIEDAHRTLQLVERTDTPEAP